MINPQIKVHTPSDETNTDDIRDAQISVSKISPEDKRTCAFHDAAEILKKLSGATGKDCCSLLGSSLQNLISAGNKIQKAGLPKLWECSEKDRDVRMQKAEEFIEEKTKLSLNSAVHRLSHPDTPPSLPSLGTLHRLNGRGLGIILNHIAFRISKHEPLEEVLKHYDMPRDTYNELMQYRAFLSAAKGGKIPALTLDGRVSCLIRHAAESFAAEDTQKSSAETHVKIHPGS